MSKIWKDSKKLLKCARWMTWSAFFVFLLLQYQLVYLYYDDFGYGSLSYGYDAGIDGLDMSLFDVIDYTLHSYLYVNGRVVTNFLLTVSSWTGGLSIMRIVMPVCILCIYLLIEKLTQNENTDSKRNMIVVIFLCFSYGCFSINVCREGNYWFAAAYGYVFPILMFLYFVRRYGQDRKVAMPVLAFLLCLASEQMAVMTVAYIFSRICFVWYFKKKIDWTDLKCIFYAVVSTLIFVCSPASRSRLTSQGNMEFHQMSMVEKLLFNSSKIVQSFFTNLGTIFVFMVLCFYFLVSIKLVVAQKKKLVKMMHLLWAGGSFLLLVLFMTGCMDLYFLERWFFWLLIYFLVSFAELLVFYFQSDYHMAAMAIVSEASVGLLLFVPEIPARTWIPFIFLNILLMTDFIRKIEGKKNSMFLGIAMVSYFIVCYTNLKSIYNGYKKNVPVLEYNHWQLSEASDRLGDRKSVKLYRLVDSIYAGQQAYQDGVSYMKVWMDEYYALSGEVEYIYYDYGTDDHPQSICYER